MGAKIVEYSSLRGAKYDNCAQKRRSNLPHKVNDLVASFCATMGLRLRRTLQGSVILFGKASSTNSFSGGEGATLNCKSRLLVYHIDYCTITEKGFVADLLIQMLNKDLCLASLSIGEG